jgi:hypothetical protein
MSLEINRAPVLTPWATVVAERLGHPADTTLTLGRAVAGSAARVKAGNIGREERKPGRDADGPGLHPDHVAAPAVLLGRSSGVVNNKAKLTMRKSYGIRTFYVTETALYHTLGKLPEPDVDHRFF